MPILVEIDPLVVVKKKINPLVVVKKKIDPLVVVRNFFFLILRMYFRYYRSLKKGVFFHLNRLEFHLLKDSLCHV